MRPREGHRPLARHDREIHTRDGLTIITFIEIECECGDRLTVDEFGPYCDERYGFGNHDEVRSGQKHFRALTYLRSMPVSTLTRICVDPHPCQAWTPRSLDDTMEAVAADMESPPPPLPEEPKRKPAVDPEDAFLVHEMMRAVPVRNSSLWRQSLKDQGVSG